MSTGPDYELNRTEETPPEETPPARTETPSAEPEPDLRDVIKKLNETNGRLQQDNAEMRRRLEAMELRTYTPAPADGGGRQPGGGGETDALDKYILDGLEADERDAPWTGTLLKTIKRVAPVFRDVAAQQARNAQAAAKVDEDFYGFLLERWGTDVTPRAIRRIEREYGKDIGELSRAIVQLPNGQVRDGLHALVRACGGSPGTPVQHGRARHPAAAHGSTGTHGRSRRRQPARRRQAPDEAERGLGFRERGPRHLGGVS